MPNKIIIDEMLDDMLLNLSYIKLNSYLKIKED